MVELAHAADVTCIPIGGGMQLQPVAPAEIATFRRMVEAYWDELMPTADVLQSLERRDA